MTPTLSRRLRIGALAGALVLAAPVEARVTRIVIDEQRDLLKAPATAGQTLDYEQFAGHAEGVLDPRDPLNAIIQDIELGKDPIDGKVHYIASWVLTVPKDRSKISGMMWQDVPNRGRSILFDVSERNFGDVGLASAWQGDNAGGTLVPQPPAMSVGGSHWVQVPVAKNRDGSTVTGLVFGRIVNRSGLNAQPLNVQNNPLPYLPATLDTAQATLVSRDHESMEGVVTGETPIAASDWKFCGGGTFDAPVALTKVPVNICLKGGFDPNKLYQVVYTAKDPYVLGVGFAAWRDVGAFFKYAAQDDFGTANPVAGRIRWSIGRGVSQSGNFLRGWLHLGFNEDEAHRRVHDGMWPIIAGRRIALDFRWAQPDGVLELYQAGSEGPQWWGKYEDKVRDLPKRGILDRCQESKTCPKIIEHFGSAEVWALKLTPEWVGTDAKKDIQLPKNVRRYYIPSSTHGGGAGGFNTSLPSNPPGQPGFLPTVGASCPGNNYGRGILPANPMPHTETVNAIRVHFRNWVMKDVDPPASVWPRLNPNAHEGDDDHGADNRGPRAPDLVDANMKAMGFPAIPVAAAFPGWRPTAPESGFINPVLDYDWGPQFDPSDATGVPTNVPPPIKQVIRMLVPRTNADGNEQGGVPVVLQDAPLGTYLGWNITAAGFHKDQVCDYVGGMIPFAKTKAERMATGDPRLSLEERYGDHQGYVNAVSAAADKAVAAGFLLPEDRDKLNKQARESAVLNP
ncbi:MAG TPA: alpha/beta hydrolase domain-containing protein [Burkholderiales bacterium]|nr:alpha/beta hydrolase domain-containing protein [Burkholderiales bacterium]